MKKEKISILTLWDSPNYGAFLQAYSLKTQCEKLGYETSFLTLTKEKRTPINFVSKSLKKTMYLINLSKAFKKDRKLFSFSDNKKEKDIVIIGSDEVWNTNNNSFIHFNQYLGRNLNAKNIISYAPSCNGVKPNDFLKVYENEDFSMVNHISVRDNSTKELVLQLSGKEPTIVIDPTLMLGEFDSIIKEPKYENYILVYGYSFLEKEINEIKEFAKQNKMKLISVGPHLKWTDIKIPASPSEFLGFVKNANYIFTSTFHGTIFSILYKKKFATYARQNCKVREILELFKLEDRNISIVNNLNEVVKKSIDYDLVEEILKKRRYESLSFLKTALMGENNNE